MTELREPVIVVHGGAGVYSNIVPGQEAQQVFTDHKKGVRTAAEAGYRILNQGGSAVDAVQAAVVTLEDDPTFNSGQGSSLTIDYDVEMDAAIMDGANLESGSVGCLKNFKNPVVVARQVMDKSNHAMFVGEGAGKFAEAQGMTTATREELVTEKSIQRLKHDPKWKDSIKREIFNGSVMNGGSKTRAATNGATNGVGYVEGEHDTVGAVAMDCHGNVAFATSTGGLSAKAAGRMGDSCVIGSGGYADNISGAVSTTGHGESFIRMCTARLVCFYMEQGCSAQEAVEKAMDETTKRTGGVGGCISICQKTGQPGVYFTSEGMSWCSIKDSTVNVGIFKDELLQDKYVENGIENGTE